MNLFESEIRKLNLDPAMKQSVIELRKICLESDSSMPTFNPEEQARRRQQEDAAMKSIQDTINLALSEVGNSSNGSLDSDALKQAVLEKVKEYRSRIDSKFGPKWGDMLELQAQKRLQKLL
jgi:hypothetical protein